MQYAVKKFGLNCIIFLVVFLAPIATINVLVDPAFLFQNGEYEEKVATALSHGSCVVICDNYDERLLRKLLIQKQKKMPEVIVLGSSRALQIRDYSSTNSLLNLSVSGSTMEDFHALFYYCKEMGWNLNRVILALDPWLLNANNNENRWRSLEDSYFRLTAEMNSTVTSPKSVIDYKTKKRIENIFSFTYFISAIEFLKNRKSKDFFQTKEQYNQEATILPDGSITYPDAFRNVSEKELSEKISEYILSNPIYLLGNFTEISPILKSSFQNFVEYLIYNNIKVSFFLSPYPPTVYELFVRRKEYINVAASEEFFRTFSNNKGIQLFGSFNPHRFHLTNSDFYDGMHLKEEMVMKLTNQLNPIISE